MPHPQRDELRERLRGFFHLAQVPLDVNAADELTDKLLSVYEPDSRAEVAFTWSATISANRPIEPSARMQFTWPRFAERERALARELNLPAPLSTVELPPEFREGPPLPDLTVCDVEDADQAADLCLTVLKRVFACPDASWLWITDIFERSNWPDPLPRPDGWPRE